MTAEGLDAAKVAAARLWASSTLPYLSAALFACEVTTAPGSGGVLIDAGWRVRADPTVIDALDVPEVGKLLLHLVTHVVRGHGDRAEAIAVRDADRSRWNRAADAETNDDLLAAGLLPPLVDTVPADLGHADGGLAETYFAAGGPEIEAPSCGAGAGGADDGDDERGDLPRGQAEMLRLAIAADIQQRRHTDPGTVAGGWVRWAEATIPSVVDWRHVLAAELRRAVAAVAGAVDYTYRRPARRTATNTLPRPVLPSLFRPVPSVAVVADTSGSMGEDELAQVLAEIDAILRRAGLASARLPVLAVDTEVHATRRVTRANQVSLTGGGGTDMGAGIDAAAALRPRPDVIVVLTDGWTPWPHEPPRGCKVIVGIIGDGDVPDDTPAWARVVPIDLR